MVTDGTKVVRRYSIDPDCFVRRHQVNSQKVTLA